MKGSPVKLGVVIVLAVVGIITLATAFDSGVSTVPTGLVAVTPSSGVSTSVKPPKTTRPEPDVGVGVHVGVYNGTSKTGQAAIVASKLSKLGYVVDQTGNTVDPAATTIVYFVKPADEAAATALATAQFTGATVEQAPEGLTVQDAAGNEVSPAKVARLLVFVGADYLSK